jgi:hypothetical protein
MDFGGDEEPTRIAALGEAGRPAVLLASLRAT